MPEAKQHLEALLQIGRILSSSLDIERVLESLMDQAIQALRAERGYLMLKREEAWEIRTARALDRAAIEADDFAISRTLVARVAQDGCSVLTSDAMHDQRFHEQTSVGLHRLRSILCVPLSIQSQVRGVLYLDHRMETGMFTREDQELLESIAAQASIALENALLYQDLREVSARALEQARRELAETQSQLVEFGKLAALGQLAAGVAHEINNPLGAIALNLSGLKRTNRDPSETRRIEIMQEALDRCRETIQRLLRFSHRDEVQDEERVDLSQVLRDGLALLEPELTRREIALEAQLEPSLEVPGRTGEFSQVALNLFLNAISALEGRPAGRLQVRCWRQGGQVFFAVRDNGCGMTEATRQRIFEPFFTTRPVGEGVGLGLSVSYRVIADHGGAIKVDSQPGEGTTFQIALPAAR